MADGGWWMADGGCARADGGCARADGGWWSSIRSVIRHPSSAIPSLDPCDRLAPGTGPGYGEAGGPSAIGTTTRTAPGTTFSSMGVCPMISPSPCTGRGCLVAIETSRRAARYRTLGLRVCRPVTTYQV